VSSKKADYKILFLQGGRWRVRPSNLRLVQAYKIFYGKKLIVPATEFTRYKKTAQQRRDFLFKLIQDIDKKRLRKLEKARRARKAKKEAENRARLDKQFMKKVRRPIEEALSDDELVMVNYYRKSKIQLLKFNEVEAVKPVDARRAKIDDTLIIPIEPDGLDYRSRLIDKTVTSPTLGKYHLAILDIDLNKTSYIEMTEENFLEAKARATQILMPSILDYFEQMRSSSQLFILRIKFLNNWAEGEPYKEHGISYYRKQITNRDQLANLFEQTFMMLFGPRDITDKTTKNKLRAKYLEGEKRIFITGATLEATEMT